MAINGSKEFSKQEIKDILDYFKKRVKEGKFYLSLNNKRQENLKFIKEHKITIDRRKEILLNLKVEDFCHSSVNRNDKHPPNDLYIFAPKVTLPDTNNKPIKLYIKFDILNKEDDRVIIVSLHECNFPIKYFFK